MYDEKKLELVNILQLCMAGAIIINAIIVCIVLEGNWFAALLACLILTPCAIINTLAAFNISPFKKRSLSIAVAKFCSIVLLLLPASIYVFIARAFDYHGRGALFYVGSWYIPNAFAVLTIMSCSILCLEVKNCKKNEEHLEKKKEEDKTVYLEE